MSTFRALRRLLPVHPKSRRLRSRRRKCRCLANWSELYFSGQQESKLAPRRRSRHSEIRLISSVPVELRERWRCTHRFQGPSALQSDQSGLEAWLPCAPLFPGEAGLRSRLRIPRQKVGGAVVQEFEGTRTRKHPVCQPDRKDCPPCKPFRL